MGGDVSEGVEGKGEMSPYDPERAAETLRIERAAERRLLITQMHEKFSRVRELSQILDEKCPRFEP